MAGVAGWEHPEREVLAPAGWSAGPLGSAGGTAGTRFAAATVGARASVGGRSAGPVAERRRGFLDAAALCRQRLGLASEDLFDLVSRAQLRRNSVHPRGCRQ